MNTRALESILRTYKNHISPEVFSLVTRDNLITYKEYISVNGGRMNSYESRAMSFKLTPAALVLKTEMNILPNCRSYYDPLTYDESVIGFIMPQSLDILKGYLLRDYLNEFTNIDGLNQHPSGLTFQEWLEVN